MVLQPTALHGHGQCHMVMWGHRGHIISGMQTEALPAEVTASKCLSLPGSARLNSSARRIDERKKILHGLVKPSANKAV